MRVPDEAASTKVTLTISFPDWKGVNIAPSTFELAVVDISPEQEAKEKKERESSREQLLQLERERLKLEEAEKQLEKRKKP